MRGVMSVLRAACVLPLAAASLDSFALVQGKSHVQRQLPDAFKKVYSYLQHAAGEFKDKKEVAQKEVGDIAFNSDVLAARLPDDNPVSQAWGLDKLKSAQVQGLKKGDFAAARFVSAGTDGKEQGHVFGGAGFTGLSPANKLHLPTSYGILAGAGVEPHKFTAAVAVPLRDANGKLSIGYQKAEATMESGHIAPGEMPQYMKAFAPVAKVVGEVTDLSKQMKVEEHGQEGKVTTLAPPEKVKEKRVVKPEEPKDEEVKREAQKRKAEEDQHKRRVAELAKDQKARADRMMQKAEEEAVAKLELGMQSPDFALYQSTLSRLEAEKGGWDFSIWWSMMRSWCLDPRRQLSEAEAAARLSQLNGQWMVEYVNKQWMVESDTSFLAIQGSVMTIEDGKLFAYSGEQIMGTTFKAYGEKFAMLTPLTSNLDNSTVTLYKIFGMNETKIRFEGGNMWKRLSAPPPQARFLQRGPLSDVLTWQIPPEAAAPQVSAERVKAVGSPLLKKVGEAWQKSTTGDERQKNLDIAEFWKEVARAAQQAFRR